MIPFELRSYVSHPSLEKPIMFRRQFTLPGLPPIGSTVCIGEITFHVRSLTWFQEQWRWVTAQALEFAEGADLLEELANLKRVGWCRVESA